MADPGGTFPPAQAKRCKPPDCPTAGGATAASTISVKPTVADMRSDAIRGLVDLLLLELIGNNWTHGYAVITQLRERSGGEIDLPEGTVYPASTDYAMPVTST